MYFFSKRPTITNVRLFTSRGAALTFITNVGLMIRALQAHGQAINVYFPNGIYGYDQQLGVTVSTRERRDYDAPGVQLDSFHISPDLDQSLFYNSSVTGIGGSGSWGSNTVASVAAQSGWSRNSLNMSAGFSRYQFFSLPNDDYTNWNLGISGGYSISDNQLIVTYSHQSYHQLGATIGVIRSSIPLLDQTDTARVEYTFNFGRFSVTPDLSFSTYRFGPGSAGGVRFSQNSFNDDALAGGATIRYAIKDQSSALLVLRETSLTYPSPPAGQPAYDSSSFAILGGLDYQARSVWRYRLLAGVEVRTFDAYQYATQIAPDVEASAIWSPTGLTTITGSLSSSIQSPRIPGISSYTLSQGRLNVDYELKRNIVLSGYSAFQYAQYAQLGSQNSASGGASAELFLNRNVKLSVEYNYTKQSGVTIGSTNKSPIVSQYSQSYLALTLRLAL